MRKSVLGHVRGPCAIWCDPVSPFPFPRLELREQKIRLDKEFGEMLGKIADRKERLLHVEKKLATLDRTRLGKEVRS